MTRLQKKCLVAAAGTHFLLVVALLCSAFIRPAPKVDDSPVLDVIPPNLIDAALSSGVKDAPPPPPPASPVTQPTPPAQNTPPPAPEPKPQPVVKPVEPTPEVEPERPKDPDAPSLEPKKEIKPKPPTPPHKIEVSLKPVKIKPPIDNHRAEEEAEAEAEAQAEAAKAAQHARDARVKAFRNAANSIRESASSSTTVVLPGDSSVAYANYATIVKSIYTQRWIPPDTVDNDKARVEVSVTIQRDGHVTDAHIIDRSGDSNVDRSVQRTLERVTDLPHFPDGTTDNERTYVIYFDLGAKRQMLE
jgi:TonB family protein